MLFEAVAGVSLNATLLVTGHIKFAEVVLIYAISMLIGGVGIMMTPVDSVAMATMSFEAVEAVLLDATSVVTGRVVILTGPFMTNFFGRLMVIAVVSMLIDGVGMMTTAADSVSMVTTGVVVLD